MFNYVIVCKINIMAKFLIISFTIFGLTNSLTIDNQVSVVRNDCYERLALGQKLKPQDVDKKLEVATVQECQMACTEEEEKCRTFSFGIGVKGNATCELSRSIIKETPDLKPIGTVSDVDYDLYIKKIGCKLVIPQNHINNAPNKPNSPYSDRPTETTNRPYSNYTNNYSSKPYRVQSSYISVASGSNPSDTRYGTGKPYKIDDSSNDRPPFRPSYLNHPYDHRYPTRKYASAYNSHSNDRLDFDPRPHNSEEYYSHGPHRIDDMPKPFRYDNYRDRPHPLDFLPGRPLATDFNYSLRPNRPDAIPESPLHSGDYNSIPKPHRPIDVPEPPSNYESKPFRPDRIPSRPEHQNNYGSRPHRPNVIPDQPNTGYENNNSRPPRPSKIPSRPDDYFDSFKPERPIQESVSYGSRPYGSERPMYVPSRPNYYDSIEYGPERPIKVPNRPDYDLHQYGPDRPNRPDSYEPMLFGPERPTKIPDRPSDGYPLSSNFPERPIKIPERPDNYGTTSYGPERPVKIPNRPIFSRPEDYDLVWYSPDRPIKIPERPDSYGSTSYGPERPIKIPERPDGYGSTSYGPERPIKIPERPDGYEYTPNVPNRPHNYGSRPYGPDRPLDDYHFYGNDNQERPFDSYKPHRPTGEYESKPQRPNFIPNKPLKGDYGNDFKPYRPYDIPDRPDYMYTPYHRPHSEINALDYDSKPTRPNEIPNKLHDFDYKPYRLRDRLDYLDRYESKDKKPFWNVYDDRYWRPTRPLFSYDYKESKEEYSNVSNSSNVTNISIEAKPNSTISDNSKGGNYNPLLTQAIGPYGDSITSILTEIKEACFRRVLAGKRILRSFVRKAVPCERLEDCQRECSDERRFVCEGFNYRLDPTGRGEGDCELIDLPLSRLDIRRDVITDADYDYYERDRNSDAPDCKGMRYYGSYSSGRHEYYDSNRRGDYYDNYNYDSYNYRHRQPRPDNYDDYDYYYGSRRGDYKDYGDYGYNYYKHEKPPLDDKSQYLPRPSYDYKPYEPYLPPQEWKFQRPFSESDQYWHKYFEDRVKDKSYWGFKEHKGDWGSYGGSYGNFGAPDSYFHYDHQSYPKHNTSYKKYYFGPYETKDWGRYGGTYGYEVDKSSNNHKDSYDYWGFKKYNDNKGLLPPYQSKPEYTGSYLPPYETGHDYMGIKHDYHDRQQHHHHHHHGSDDYQGYIKDQCSLRMAAGFRLHKGIIKKITSVPNIYECELLCYRERDFPCASYAFRYTVINNIHKENCYLSDRSFKELDYYTDLEPDRDYDIYTINNKNTCLKPPKPVQEKSDCFWRVRSGQRLDHRIVRDSLTIKSIVDCQLECLRSRVFTCRAFSFRYGPPTIGGAIDNCQLTDWPYYDLNPHIHFIPEPGYEIYERGSYGYGCEPNHIEIGHRPSPTPADKMDQVCYLKYEKSARLLPQATKKSLVVANEYECKAECTRAREKGTFQCMSFSYRLQAVKGTSNCDLSDILQRDLLSNVDYVADPDAWLFAWDLHNPNCVSVIVVGSTIFGGESILDDHGSHHKEDGNIPFQPVGRPQDTWKVYSVSGLPCKRGTYCQENKVAGFWYCELENKEEFSWDYCCNPDHHCGYSEGFPYQWCYVGSLKTQWRKCNDHYYPYGSTITDRYDYHNSHPHLPGPSSNHVPDYSPISKPSFRPDRPPPDDHFLDPPKPGGFGQSRHWPISYLHKELPQNNSLIDVDSKFDLPKAPKSRNIDASYQAIGNLIETIKSSELKMLQDSNNSTDESNDSVYVKIPLPLNTTGAQLDSNIKPVGFETVDINTSRQNNTQNNWQRVGRSGRVYTRSYITKTNRTAANEELKRGSSEPFLSS